VRTKRIENQYDRQLYRISSMFVVHLFGSIIFTEKDSIHLIKETGRGEITASRLKRHGSVRNPATTIVSVSLFLFLNLAVVICYICSIGQCIVLYCFPSIPSISFTPFTRNDKDFAFTKNHNCSATSFVCFLSTLLISIKRLFSFGTEEKEASFRCCKPSM